MIQQAIALLNQVGLELTAEEIADIFWLALQMGETESISESPSIPKTPLSERPITEDFSPETPPINLNPPTATASEPYAELYPSPPPASIPQSDSHSPPSASSPSPQLDSPPPSQLLPFETPAAPALRNPLAIARAIRPLMRKVPSRTETILDEEATARQIAEKNIWIPVLEPAPERWLELALVIEESSSLPIWQETIAEFQTLLERQGAFRDVRTWRLNANADESLYLLPGQGSATLKQRPRNPKELIDPSGRRLILLVSDCVSDIWRSGKIQTLLRRWANQNPVSVLQLLPESYWRRSGLGAGISVQLGAFAPGVPNSQLVIEEIPPWLEVNLATALPLPVVTLEPEPLAQWARLVAGTGGTRMPGVLFDPALMEAMAEEMEQTIASRSASELVQHFRATASSTARRLAGLMAAIPVTLPVVRLIQETMLPESGQIHIAEVFMSGLLRPILEGNGNSPDGENLSPNLSPARREALNASPSYPFVEASYAGKGAGGLSFSHQSEPIYYDFQPGVRELLLDSIPISDTDEVLEQVSQFIARKAGVSIKSFTAFLSPYAKWDETVQKQIAPFAQVTRQVLRRLGGEYAALAEQLERRSPVIPDISDDAVSGFPPLQTFTLEEVTISLKAETETALDLQAFDFKVAKIQIQNAVKTAEEAVFAMTGRSFNDIQKGILRGALKNKTYEEIAVSGLYSSVYVKSIGAKLWKLLTEALNQKVSKTNLNAVLGKGLTIHHFQQQAWSFTEDLGKGIQLEMVAIPEGSFVRGAPEDETGRENSESPQHTVTVNSFFMGKYTITQAQWQIVADLPRVNRELEPDPSEFKSANRPVENVSWYDAMEFCDRLSQKTGRLYRLPSEAEWEYACRAGTTTPFHFGETITIDLANYRGTDDKRRGWSGSYGQSPKGIDRQETTPVGSFKVANDFGLYDMHGNVWEWCADPWHENYEGAPTDGRVWKDDNDHDNEHRVLRGGSWFDFPVNCRCACRFHYSSNDRNVPVMGFRVVCAAE
ncbi:SAV_2336 N-terminal domain-related protein [Coleofasciculus sp. E1-EBD-02]|uniref:SAV_2336 N-terminal domain-related protein n=1 Tax=Coleofasciculus sp. E1-EBD-02 TaxID=3068481 RepID=UPI0032FBB05B